jgi:4-hydroxy-tetrahydrodipicolinate synthase
LIKEQLKGTGVAIVTPFKSDESIDFLALEKLINFNIDNGVNYLVTLGTTGETPTLSKQEKKDIVNFTIEKVNGRVPIVLGIGGNNTKEVINDFSQFDTSKIASILSASPYYNKPTQEGLFLHYKALANEAPKPILLYNVPGRTGRNLSAATTAKLSNEIENIAGIKEASDSLQQAMEIVRDCRKDFLIVSGDDALSLSQIALGFDGVISVAANCFPKQFSSMISLALNNNFEAARSIHYKLLQGYDYLFEENNPAGAKAFLFELGLIENELRLPLTKASETLQEKIKQFLKNI